MENPKENPYFEGILADDSKVGADDVAELPKRLDRYSKAHHRAIEMAYYASDRGEVKLSRNLHMCGSYLLFRDYYTVGKVRLHAAKFCNKHLLCPLCAIRRGAKMVKSYLDRLRVILSQNPELKPYLVTLTVKDGPDLYERFKHLQNSVKFLHRTRSRDGQYSEACKADAAVWSYEFKRGKNSGEWHPHVHAVWLCKDVPDQTALSAQWKKITGDSFIVDVRPFHDDADVLGGFLEVFKYAVKFSDLPLEDNWTGFETLSGKRLIASFGLFRGIDFPENLDDESLDDLPYIEALYKFIYGAGYSYVQKTDLPSSNVKRSKGRSPTIAADPYKKGRGHLLKLRQKYSTR